MSEIDLRPSGRRGWAVAALAGFVLVAGQVAVIGPAMHSILPDTAGGFLRHFLDALVTMVIAAVALFAGARLSVKHGPEGRER